MAQLKSTVINGSLTVSNLTSGHLVTTGNNGLLTTLDNGDANSVFTSNGTQASWESPKLEGVTFKDGVLHYGLSSTAANTAAKTVTLTGPQTFTLVTGARVLIKFQYANTVASPTLNVNSTGAKNIYAYGTTNQLNLISWQANEVVEFIYDGNYWLIVGSPSANPYWRIDYTTCSTAANTTAKTASLTNFVLETGARVSIKFTYSNTATNPTLNINSTGAKAIKTFGTEAVGTTESKSWKPGAIITFIYDGTNWLMASGSGGGIEPGAVNYLLVGQGATNEPIWKNILGSDITLGGNQELNIGAQLSKSGSATLITSSNYTTYFTQNQNGPTYTWSYKSSGTYWQCTGTQDKHNIAETASTLQWTAKSNMILQINYQVHSESVNYDWLRVTVNAGEKLKVGGSNQSGSIELQIKTNDIVCFYVRKDSSSNPSGEYYRVTLNRFATTSVSAVNVNKLFFNGEGDFGNQYKPIYINGGLPKVTSFPYTTCTTSANTTAKTASLTNFVLETGAFVFIKFTYINTATNPTLNINSTGAKQIMKYGTTPPGNVAELSWHPNSVVGFVYDGTYWQMMNAANMIDAYVV